MKIGPTHKSLLPSHMNVERQVFGSHFSNSTVASLSEGLRSKKYVVFGWLKSKATRLFAWIKRLFCFGKKKPPSIEFFKVTDSSGDKIKYRMIDKGAPTDNEVSVGKRFAYLGDISLPEEDLAYHLPDMIEKIMEDEKIDVLLVNNLAKAKNLWDSGLLTKSTIAYQVGGSAPLDRFIDKVTKKAYETRSSTSLKRIEDHLVNVVVCEGFMHEGKTQDFTMKHLAPFLDVFPNFDLKGALVRLKSEAQTPIVESTLRDIENWLEDEAFDFRRKSAGALEADIPIHHLFQICDEVDLKIDRQLIGHLQDIAFRSPS